jgi:hypothetical protein
MPQKSVSPARKKRSFFLASIADEKQNFDQELKSKVIKLQKQALDSYSELHALMLFFQILRLHLL